MADIKRKVFIEGGGQAYERMFTDRGWEVVDYAEDADLIQFTGGEDVTPYLYNEEAHPQTCFNPPRDVSCTILYEKYKDVPKAGICRGGQFLNVINGGKMYQHIDGHANGQMHKVHVLGRDNTANAIINVSSTHHQMMRPSKDGIVLVWAFESLEREFMNDKKIEVDIKLGHRDVESVFYAHTLSLSFQPHPEFFKPGHPCQELYFDLLQEHLGL